MGLSLVALPVPACAQGIRSIIESRERVFPGIGAGVVAIKRASDGRYYIVARPANTIHVYNPDGTLVGLIPKPGSGVAIRYIASIDVTPGGLIAVADRGANAIEVFRPDGSLVSKTPVFAPTSVVALPDGQFAVTTLRSTRLVQLIDHQGNVLQRFGDPSDVLGSPQTDMDADTAAELDGVPPPQTNPLHDFGTITGDASGGIYFAFASTPNPTLRKYDQYGYEAYQASIPKSDFAGGAVQPEDRVQVLFGLSDVGYSSQEGGWLNIGSSRDVKFGGDVGTGIAESFQRGYGFAQAIQQQSTGPAGSPGAMGGPLGATFSGEVNDQGSSFQLGMGSTSGLGGRGRRMNFGGFGDQAANQGGALLEFSGSNNNSAGATDSLDSAGSGMTEELGMNGSSDSTDDSNAYSSTWLGSPNVQGQGLTPMGLPAAFMVGSSLDGIYFRPHGLSQEITGVPPSGSTGASGLFRHAGATDTGTHTGGAAGAGFHPGDHGRFRSGELAFTAGVRVNLGALDRGLAVNKPEITAVAVDPETHDVWAAIADTLVEFNSNGNPVGMYYLTLGGGESLRATALLVEQDRLLIAADPWGIFEFPRPDESSAPQHRFNVVPKVLSQPR
jgi:hypothetical protein